MNKEKEFPTNILILLLTALLLVVWFSLYLPSTSTNDSQEAFDKATPYMDASDKALLMKNFMSESDKRDFSAESGSEVSDVVEEWSKLSGYDLIWNHKDDYTINTDIKVYGDIAEALGIMYSELSNVYDKNNLSIKISVFKKTIIVD